MRNNLALRPSYWASVSGGKDSLYMLNLILHNLDRYPLDGVVHFELEIDYPFIKDVVDYMESECKRFGIRFVRIKPRRTWDEIYHSMNEKQGHMFGFPIYKKRWCNDMYKLDAKRQLNAWLKENGRYCVIYIGYCADEEKRFKSRKNGREVYPLVDFGINEAEIWQWAKEQPLYNNYYKTQKRCGCMYCPLASYLNYAYLLKYYPENFNFMIGRMRETEKMLEKYLGRPFAVKQKEPKYNADYVNNIVRTKWLKILEEKEREEENA